MTLMRTPRLRKSKVQMCLNEQRKKSRPLLKQSIQRKKVQKHNFLFEQRWISCFCWKKYSICGWTGEVSGNFCPSFWILAGIPCVFAWNKLYRWNPMSSLFLAVNSLIKGVKSLFYSGLFQVTLSVSIEDLKFYGLIE